MSESDLDAALKDVDSSDATGGEEEGENTTPEGTDEGGEAGESDLSLSSELDSALAESEIEGEGGLELDDDLNKLAESVGDTPSGGEMVTPPEIGGLANLSDREVVNLEFLLDIKLHVTFEVGRSKMLISDLLTLGQGSVIELHRLVGDELDLLINGKLVAKGEVVVVNEKFGCRINEIIPPQDRVKHLAEYR